MIGVLLLTMSSHMNGDMPTQNGTSDLIYAFESGALNEAYSDIWGETIDLLNNYNDEGEDLSSRTDCTNSLRWKMGEDTSSGIIRDMWNPNCNNDPGKVSDSNFVCGAEMMEGGFIPTQGLQTTYMRYSWMEAPIMVKQLVL